jgi:hypothetical protein
MSKRKGEDTWAESNREIPLRRTPETRNKKLVTWGQLERSVFFHSFETVQKKIAIAWRALVTWWCTWLVFPTFNDHYTHACLEHNGFALMFGIAPTDNSPCFRFFLVDRTGNLGDPVDPGGPPPAQRRSAERSLVYMMQQAKEDKEQAVDNYRWTPTDELLLERALLVIVPHRDGKTVRDKLHSEKRHFKEGERVNNREVQAYVAEVTEACQRWLPAVVTQILAQYVAPANDIEAGTIRRKHRAREAMTKAKVESDRLEHNNNARLKRKRQEEGMKQQKLKKAKAQLTQKQELERQNEQKWITLKDKSKAEQDKRKAEEAPIRSTSTLFLQGLNMHCKSKEDWTEEPHTLQWWWGFMKCNGECPSAVTLGKVVTTDDFTKGLFKLCGWEMSRKGRRRANKSDHVHKTAKTTQRHVYILRLSRANRLNPGTPHLPKKKQFDRGIDHLESDRARVGFSEHSHHLCSSELQQPLTATARKQPSLLRSFFYNPRVPKDPTHDDFCPESNLRDGILPSRTMRKCIINLDIEHTAQECEFLAVVINTGTEHWAAIVHKKGSLQLEVFDGFGRKIAGLGYVRMWVKILQEAMGLTKQPMKNNKDWQFPDETQCGVYALWFIWQRCQGIEATRIMKCEGFSGDDMKAARKYLLTTTQVVLDELETLRKNWRNSNI